MNFFKLSLVRGLIAQFLGTFVGVLLTIIVRVLMGLPAWKSEPVFVGGALVGVVAFMFGTGVLNDWIKWAKGEETPETTLDSGSLKGLAKYLHVSYDHKVIGIQYGITSVMVFLVAGLFALIFRTELAQTGLQFLTEDGFNSMMSLHGIVNIGGILLGVAAMSNYLVPLMIGANDMAFPRLNSFAF